MTLAATEIITSSWDESQLRSLNERFRGASPEAILDWATAEFGDTIALTCSFGGTSGMVIIDMLSRIERQVPVIFLETGLLFPETYELAEIAERRYGIPIRRYQSAITLEEQDRIQGPELFSRDPDRCCGIRKVTPLADALRPFDGWISGLRRDQSKTRATTETFQWNAKHKVLKVSPLAYWTERDVWRYIHAHEVPYNTLLDRGYPSLGCMPCTTTTSGNDLRAGRWAGTGKIECGIHL